MPSTKPSDIPFIKISEAMHFIGCGNGTIEASHDLHSELKTQIHPLGANVKNNVTRCGDGVSRSRANFAKGMELGWARQAEQPVPGIRAEAHYARKSTIEGAKTNRTKKR